MAKKQPDKILFFCALLLLTLGSIMIFGISAPFSQESFGKSYLLLSHQLLYGILPGLILGFLAFKVKISDLKKIALPLFLANLVLVFLVFLPQIGLALGGARRWVKIGPISFQPSEFLKITLFIYLAAWLEKRREKDLSQLGMFLVILAPVALALILQPDISTLSLLISTALAIYFLADTPILHTFLTGALCIAALFLLIRSAPYRMERFLVFLSPGLEPMGMGYQTKQAQIAIGSGGIFGKGLGMSRQKFGFLPHPTSDSIFAIFCEETGLIGSLTLIVFFVIFLIRGLKIAKRTKAEFSKLLSYAICLQIALQAFLNIASMIGVLPLTGAPLPFISYGGTHIVAEMIGVGILLNISRS